MMPHYYAYNDNFNSQVVFCQIIQPKSTNIFLAMNIFVKTCFLRPQMKRERCQKKVRRPGTERQRSRVGTTPYGSQDLNSKTWD